MSAILTLSLLKGSWSKGVRKGQGVCIYSDGCRYEGHWQDDKVNNTNPSLIFSKLMHCAHSVMDKAPLYKRMEHTLESG